MAHCSISAFIKLIFRDLNIKFQVILQFFINLLLSKLKLSVEQITCVTLCLVYPDCIHLCIHVMMQGDNGNMREVLEIGSFIN